MINKMEFPNSYRRKKMNVKSVFSNNENIPKKFTCDGQNISPPIEIENIPEGTKSLALIVDDPDAPGGMFVHWVTWNISPQKKIEENTAPGKQGTNDFPMQGYGGPCPPSGTHRYFFKVYALDSELDISSDSKKQDLEKAMQTHIIEKAELIGLYKRE